MGQEWVGRGINWHSQSGCSLRSENSPYDPATWSLAGDSKESKLAQQGNMSTSVFAAALPTEAAVRNLPDVHQQMHGEERCVHTMEFRQQ